MKQICSGVLGVLATVLAGGAMAAGHGHDEASQGELSPFFHYPTTVLLAPGRNTIAGVTSCAGGALCDQGDKSEPMPEWIFDRDFWTVEVPAGYLLRKIIVADYQGPAGGGSFFAVAKGTRIERVDSDSGLLGTTLVGGLAGAPKGGDALPWLGYGIYGGEGFEPPLAAGKYTFWFQEANGNTQYAFDFRLQPVPEPATVGMLAAGLGVVGVTAARRRRRQPA